MSLQMPKTCSITLTLEPTIRQPTWTSLHDRIFRELHLVHHPRWRGKFHQLGEIFTHGQLIYLPNLRDATLSVLISEINLRNLLNLPIYLSSSNSVVVRENQTLPYPSLLICLTSSAKMITTYLIAILLILFTYRLLGKKRDSTLGLLNQPALLTNPHDCARLIAGKKPDPSHRQPPDRLTIEKPSKPVLATSVWHRKCLHFRRRTYRPPVCWWCQTSHEFKKLCIGNHSPN